MRAFNESEFREEHTFDSAMRKLFVRLVALFLDIYEANPSTGSNSPETVRVIDGENFPKEKGEAGRMSNEGAEPEPSNQTPPRTLNPIGLLGPEKYRLGLAFTIKCGYLKPKTNS